MTGTVSVHRDDAVLRVELSNPERRNAISWEMYDALESLPDSIDRSVRVVLIRGAGGAAFAAGTDINQFTEFNSAADGVDYEHRVARVLDRLLGIEVPVVAVVEGPAVGAGLAIAACCDLVIATTDAVFGAPIGRTLGNCLAPEVLARLRERLGASRTMAMLLTARLLGPTEVGGLVHEIVERDALEEAVERLVADVVRNAPLTLSALKEIDRRLRTASVDADDVLAACYGSRDFREGVEAFLDHRRPRWEGR